MEKTEGKKTVIVIDEQGNQYESTYPKRAKGLVKSGRARYVDDNTILILACPPNNMEEKKMNNNENTQKTLNLEYILNKIDEIIEINQAAMARNDLSEFSNVPGTKNPIQALCDTNNEMIAFLKEIYFNMQPKMPSFQDKILEGYMLALDSAVENENEELIEQLTSAINELAFRCK